jgi:hypothetical protein|tara:strand:+ start:392 stop:598 length:207 start_codon:yes stop_codon:yes gene_type:complete
MKVVCEFCGGSLNPKTQGAYKQVLCWLEPGKSSGAKLVADAAGWAHPVCIEIETRKRKGQTSQEESLF